MWIAGITVILWYSPIGFGWYFLVFIGDGYDICMKWYDIWLYIPKSGVFVAFSTSIPGVRGLAKEIKSAVWGK